MKLYTSNPFVSNAPFLYPLQTSENPKERVNWEQLGLKISAVSSQHPVNKKRLDDKAIVAFYESFLVSKTNMNLLIYSKKKYLGSIFVIFEIHEGYMRKIYDTIYGLYLQKKQ